MSETELHKGKLVPLLFSPEKTKEECAEFLCKRMGYERDYEYEDTWMDTLNENGYREIFIYENRFYQVLDTEYPDMDAVDGTLNADGSIDYLLAYYNGGASFNEVLEQVMEKVKK